MLEFVIISVHTLSEDLSAALDLLRFQTLLTVQDTVPYQTLSEDLSTAT